MRGAGRTMSQAQDGQPRSRPRAVGVRKGVPLMRERRCVHTPRRLLVAVLGCALAGWLLVMPAAPVAATTLTVTDCGDSGANTPRGNRAAPGAGPPLPFPPTATRPTAHARAPQPLPARPA